jgi:hypothetical protein
MSKHVGRKKRWAQVDVQNYRSGLGRVTRERDGWYALLDYKTLVPPQREGGLPGWRADRQRLGPFRRPRDAMVALEREATMLRNRHGAGLLIGEEVWGEAGRAPSVRLT